MEIETPREEEPNGEASSEPAEAALNVDTGENADKSFFDFFFVKLNMVSLSALKFQQRTYRGKIGVNDQRARNWIKIEDSSLFTIIYAV